MDIEVMVRVTSSYGTERIYPVSQQAVRLANLMNVKTFTRPQINRIKELGFSVTTQSEVL